MLQLWLGAVLAVIGIVMVAVAGFGYYEEEKHKPVSLGLLGLLERYRMWLMIGGVALLVVGGGMGIYDSMM